jgi:hypothetical protein
VIDDRNENRGEIKARINILVHLFQDIESEKKIMKKTKEGWVGFDKMTYLLKLAIKCGDTILIANRYGVLFAALVVTRDGVVASLLAIAEVGGTGEGGGGGAAGVCFCGADGFCLPLVAEEGGEEGLGPGAGDGYSYHSKSWKDPNTGKHKSCKCPVQ